MLIKGSIIVGIIFFGIFLEIFICNMWYKINNSIFSNELFQFIKFLYITFIFYLLKKNADFSCKFTKIYLHIKEIKKKIKFLLKKKKNNEEYINQITKKIKILSKNYISNNISQQNFPLTISISNKKPLKIYDLFLLLKNNVFKYLNTTTTTNNNNNNKIKNFFNKWIKEIKNIRSIHKEQKKYGLDLFILICLHFFILIFFPYKIKEENISLVLNIFFSIFLSIFLNLILILSFFYANKI